MARWVALGLAGQRVGEPFEAPDRARAEAEARARVGDRCFRVQSLLSWEQTQAELRELERKKARLAGED